MSTRLPIRTGIALRTRITLALDLPSMFWKELCGEAVTRADIEAVDRTFVRTVLEAAEKCQVCCAARTCVA